jgi:hypothetical protein
MGDGMMTFSFKTLSGDENSRHDLLTTMVEEAPGKQEGPMKCYRCSSKMVFEKFFGPHEHFWGWRCIFCGEIVDQVILENRGSLRTQTAANGRTRRR